MKYLTLVLFILALACSAQGQSKRCDTPPFKVGDPVILISDVVTLPPCCEEVDRENHASFKVGDRVLFRCDDAAVCGNSRGTITQIDHGLYYVTPDGDPHQAAIDRERRALTGQDLSTSLRLEELKRTYPGPLCATGPKLGAETGFTSTFGFKHLKSKR